MADEQYRHPRLASIYDTLDADWMPPVVSSADESTADWFVRLNNTGGPVDVWAFECVDEDELVDGGSGYPYLPRRVPPEALRLVQRDPPPEVAPKPVTTSGGAYQSMLTVTSTDGTVPTGEQAHAHVRDVSRE